MRTKVILVFCAVSVAVPIARADAITADGTYYEFVAYTVGAPVEPCGTVTHVCLPSTNPAGITYTAATPWTFAGPANLLVLDLFLSGDQYQVFDNGVSLGTTSTPLGPPVQCGQPLVADIGCSLSTPNFSRGDYVLGTGSHSITIDYLVTTTVGHSGAALQLTAVPEPSTGVLLVFGMVALAAARKRATSTLRGTHYLRYSVK